MNRHRTYQVIPYFEKYQGGGRYNLKRISRFLVYKELVNDQFIIRQCVSFGGESYHSPFFLEMARLGRKPPIPFKFNASWIEEGGFVNLVKDNFNPFDGSRREFASIQFEEKLK